MTMPRSGENPVGSGALPAALALAVLLAGAGCAAATPRAIAYREATDRTAPAYKFTIAYREDRPECPRSATSDWANCNPDLPPNHPDPKQPKDCTRVKHGSTVELAGAPGKPFVLQFDPFGLSAIPVNGTTGALPFARYDEKGTGTSRAFTFRVTAPGCPPVDPQIIIDW